MSYSIDGDGTSATDPQEDSAPLGVASLVGVLVSHIIVLFDFIEDGRARGEPLLDALLDAGIVRLRPVLITGGPSAMIVAATLTSNGGRLWQPMCYAQIGGLMFATFVTLLLVPVIYAVFVLDLKLVKRERDAVAAGAAELHDHRAPTKWRHLRDTFMARWPTRSLGPGNDRM